jgi:UDP-N-acetyl-D-galactosamine dehydrogenase
MQQPAGVHVAHGDPASAGPEGPRIAVVGLGYVGLPLALAFARRHDTLGFDIDRARLDALRAGHDASGEASPDELAAAAHLRFSADPAALEDREVFIVTVPTPVDASKRPDFSPLLAASRTVGAALRPGGLVVYESTVYPGATEEICVPVLEAASGLRFGVDFEVGYSPERINPGDRQRRLGDIVKLTSGSSPAAAERVDALYRAVIPAGTHRCASLRVAEAAKVLENIQRDVNIALMNECARLFERIGLDTGDVLAAAGTKWNFLPFRPGLVGGHCIGVDPYYLIQKAQSVGYHPDLLVASRRINDQMGEFVASQVVKALLARGGAVAGARIGVLGLAFKEDCADLRNTRVVELIAALRGWGAEVLVHDPVVDAAEAGREYGLALAPALPAPGTLDAVVLAVPHARLLALGPDALRGLVRAGGVLFDVKGALPRDLVDGRL